MEDLRYVGSVSYNYKRASRTMYYYQEASRGQILATQYLPNTANYYTMTPTELYLEPIETSLSLSSSANAAVDIPVSNSGTITKRELVYITNPLFDVETCITYEEEREGGRTYGFFSNSWL